MVSFPWLLASVFMLVHCVITRTIFSSSEIRHISPMRDLRQSYGDLLKVRQTKNSEVLSFKFRDATSFELSLKVVDLDYLIALLSDKSPSADIDLGVAPRDKPQLGSSSG